MTPAINYNAHWHKSCSNTSLLSIDYTTRTHTQMRKSPRKEKESGKEMRRETERKKSRKLKKLTKIEK